MPALSPSMAEERGVCRVKEHYKGLSNHLELRMNFRDYCISQMLTCLTWIPRQIWLPPLLLHPQFLAWAQPERSEEMMAIYQRAVDKHFTSRLHDIAQGHKPTGVEMRMLVRTLQTDAVQTAIIPITSSAEYMVKERM